ncbi:MAG: hypothetical protein AAFV33_22300, partial [Chloroflexota bacterium]
MKKIAAITVLLAVFLLAALPAFAEEGEATGVEDLTHDQIMNILFEIGFFDDLTVEEFNALSDEDIDQFIDELFTHFSEEELDALLLDGEAYDVLRGEEEDELSEEEIRERLEAE